jgi:hypothetical protein
MQKREDSSSRKALFVSAILVLEVTGCASAPPPPQAAPIQTAHAVSAIVLVNRCGSLGTADAKLAEKEMNQLLEGCGTYTGGTVRFTATLLPGGAMQFDPRQGETTSIPICVLSRPLKHGVHLTKSCSLDIALEETSMVIPAKVSSPR